MNNAIREFNKKHKGKQNMILSENLRMKLEGRVSCNTIVVGRTGSGKTSSFVEPNVREGVGSYVIVDPAGSIYKNCKDVLEKKGYDIKVFNTMTGKDSNTYNPLKYCRNENDVKRLVINLVENADNGNDPFWNDALKSFLNACVALLTVHFRHPFFRVYTKVTGNTISSGNLGDLIELIHMAGKKYTPGCRVTLNPDVDPGDKEISQLAVIFENIRATEKTHNVESFFALREWDMFLKTPVSTRKKIITTAAAMLDVLSTGYIKDMTSSDTTDLDAFRCPEKKALFIITHPNDRTYNVLTTLLIDQIINMRYRYYDGFDAHYEKDPEMIRIFMEDFSGMGRVPDIANRLATMRNARMQCVITCRSLEDIKTAYPKAYNSIIACCPVMVALGDVRDDKFTADHISRRSKRVRCLPSELKTVEVITKDEIEHMSPNDEIVMVSGDDPVIDRKYSDGYKKYIIGCAAVVCIIGILFRLVKRKR